MRNKIALFCMAAGTALVLAALSLFLWNQGQNQKAGNFAEEILPQVVAYAAQPPQEEPAQSDFDMAWGDEEEGEMPVAEIDGYQYVGYLTIPTLELELPVMAGWSYPQLKIAPCRYSGSTKTDDLVICAHNYERHFGEIKNLSPGDPVTFTDMEGIVTTYTVVTVETLQPAAIEEMTAGDYDLTLFTCTYGGQSRVTVRCEGVNG